MSVKVEMRNECANLVRASNRVRKEIRVYAGESQEHQEAKIKRCKELLAEGKEYITEAIFKTGGRADILVLDDFTAEEIVVTESEESLARKQEDYPAGIKLKIIRVPRKP